MKIFDYYKKIIGYFSIIIFSTILSTVITGKFNMKMDGLLNLIYLIVGLSIFLGSLLYLYDTYIGPKIRVKKLRTSNFTNFHKIGFKNNKDYLIGKIDDYTVIVSYNWRNDNGIQSLYTIILFDPRINEKQLNNYFINKWQKSIKDRYNYWEYGRFCTEWPLEKGKPKFKTIIKKLRKNIQLILSKDLKYIEFTKWENEIENYLKTTTHKAKH